MKIIYPIAAAVLIISEHCKCDNHHNFMHSCSSLSDLECIAAVQFHLSHFLEQIFQNHATDYWTIIRQDLTIFQKQTGAKDVTFARQLVLCHTRCHRLGA